MTAVEIRDRTPARFKALGAPMPQEKIQWRQDGRPANRNGRWYARFVAYIDPRAVQQRLDDICPGEWSLDQELLPERADEDGVLEVSMKASLTVMGVTRSCIGSGSTYKNAASDAFKRAAVRFGVASELYDYGPNWVEVDGDGKYAKAVEDPATAYTRKGRGGLSTPAPRAVAGESAPDPAVGPSAPPSGPPTLRIDKPCPKCGGPMYNNVAENNQRAASGEKLRPDYKCKRSTCDGKIWRKKELVDDDGEGYPSALVDDQDDLPF